MLDRIKNVLSRTALKLSPKQLEVIAGSKPYVWEGRALDPQLHVVAKAYAAESPLHLFPIKLARTQYAEGSKLLDSPRRKSVKVKDRTIELSSAAGVRTVGIRIFNPPQLTNNPIPVMVYYHGGGWSVGSSDTVDALCSGFAEDLNHVVISVDYRLAPEHQYPAAADDAVDSFVWLKNNVYVAGDSAGGNLAAVVSQQTVKNGLPAPSAQVLIYPATDLRNCTLTHHTQAEGLPLCGKTINWFVGMYMGCDTHKQEIKASPGLAEGKWLEKLPPAIITTAGFDVLRDEGAAYAKYLESLGVSVWYHEYSHLMHAYVTMTGHIEAAEAAVKHTTEQIRKLIKR
ncbi:MAG: alpha/beta hydrolase [Pseudomonadales bacterium]|nr:alpha/beta hydrolase [Pseudomonadales bacterium]